MRVTVFSSDQLSSPQKSISIITELFFPTSYDCIMKILIGTLKNCRRTPRSLLFSISVETDGSYLKSVFSYLLHLNDVPNWLGPFYVTVTRVLLFGKGSVRLIQSLQTKTVYPYD